MSTHNILIWIFLSGFFFFFPTEIGNLSNLLTLEASNNSLCYIPLEVGYCTRLKVISFDRNKLTWFPRQLCNLRFLEELSVCGNLLEFIPQSKFHQLLKTKQLNKETRAQLFETKDVIS